MNEATAKPKHQVGGLPTNVMLIPAIIITAIFHIAIIGLFLSINTQTAALSKNSQLYGQYISDATSLLAGSSLLSETSTNYILLPVAETGEINFSSLIPYNEELGVDRRGDQVTARFQSYNVSDDIKADIADAAASANYMMENQLHAIALTAAVHPYPSIPPLAGLPVPELTSDEQALTDAEKLSTAKMLILNEEYAAHKQNVSQTVNSVAERLQGESGRMSAETAQSIARTRTLLLGCTIAIIVILAWVFILFFSQMIAPIKNFSKLINSDHSLDERKGLREIRLLAFAYNGLLRRRAALEGILRSAAETDTLTHLPNRYSYEHFLLSIAEAEEPVAVVQFDVNYLKQTNDLQGHSAGDRLLQTAAACIEKCFGTGEEKNCFRIGGDEFTAVIRNPEPDKISRMGDQFIKEQTENQVSISWGYAMTDNPTEESIKEMIDKADRNMYEQKQRMHAEDGHE